jgi:phosphatidylcholine synthase
VRALAFLVHILTASGAALALFALIAATRDEWPLMFLLLGCALIVDAVDGPLARRLDVTDVLPRWSGEVLDLVVDFTTYVFIPAYAVAASGLMPGSCCPTLPSLSPGRNPKRHTRHNICVWRD